MGGRFTRRQVVASAGLAAAGGVMGVGLDAAAGADSWSQVASPTSKTLYDVVTAADGYYAVGGSGTVVHRGGGTWTTVMTDGPTGNNKTLRGAGVTDDGERVWLAGSSGRLAEYDVSSGEVTNHTKPVGAGNTFTDVAVAGPVGDERVFCTMGSGRLVYGKHEGDDAWEWEVKETHSGYTLTAVDFSSQRTGRVVGNGGGVFETTDGGKTWHRVGIEDAVNPLNDVISGTDHVYVAASNGRVWREDCTCSVWTPVKPVSTDLNALDRSNEQLLGAGGSGRIVERLDGDWVGYEGPVGNVLLGCQIGSPDVVVGKSGTILER